MKYASMDNPHRLQRRSGNITASTHGPLGASCANKVYNGVVGNAARLVVHNPPMLALIVRQRRIILWKRKD